MEDIEVLNKILYDFTYDSEFSDELYMEDFNLLLGFKSIILDNKTIFIQSDYHKHVKLTKSIKYSYEFLKTLDKSYADKLMENIQNGIINLYPRKKDEITIASLEVDREKRCNKITIPYNSTIEDVYTLTHEQLHDTNMDPSRLNTTCCLLTEMISFLGDLLQRDYFEKGTTTPKEYRKNMNDAFFATRIYAMKAEMELDLIRRFLNKGFIDFQDMRDICKSKTVEELEIINDNIEEILENGELNLQKSQKYVIGNVLACYLHQRILDNPKNIKEFNEVNELLNIYSEEEIFEYLGLDILEDSKFFNLTQDSYKVLRKCYNNEIKRL